MMLELSILCSFFFSAMSISKLNAAWLHGEQENNFGLLHLNFDFSLVKLESPPEFRGLGSLLSTRRRQAAEDGPIHATARKLGALFEETLPSTLDLFAAYGNRASEIAKLPKFNPKGTKADGAFAEHLGVEGTGIWAAATSGKGAIGVHLLACMLARVWTRPEALAIWREIVAERKEELLRMDESGSLHIKALAAAQVTLTEDQLSSWDASARAWLQTADKAMEKRQLQFMLIVNNLNKPVNTKQEVYSNVLQSWKSAMITADKLVQGVPQVAQDGASLLGLSSWHLYPDMVVLSATGGMTKEIRQQDCLVKKGGTLTLGLESISPLLKSGVFWSLPLAHLRYYGEPVISSRSTSADGSQISFQMLEQVALGSAFSAWGTYIPSDIQKAYAVRSLWDYILRPANNSDHGTDNVQRRKELQGIKWLSPIAEAAKDFSDSQDSDGNVCRLLFAFGQRQGASFLGHPDEHPTPFFGLSDFETVFDLMNSEEDRISLLRYLAPSLGAQPNDIIIRYRVDSLGSFMNQGHYEYASALPIRRSSTKRDNLGTQYHSYGHQRWIPQPEDLKSVFLKYGGFVDPVTGPDPAEQRKSSENRIRSIMTKRIAAFESAGESRIQLRPLDVVEISDATFRWENFMSSIAPGESFQIQNRQSTDHPSFKVIVGDPKSAAIFLRNDKSLSKDRKVSYTRMEYPVLEYCLGKELLNKSALRTYLADLAAPFSGAPKHGEHRYYWSLRALAVAKDIYARLPNASVSLGVTMKPLVKAKWAQQLTRTHQMREITRSQAFSCITTFSTGRIDLHPDSFRDVMAICFGDSIYVAAALQSDPHTPSHPSDIRMLVGNVGRAGLSLLVPPAKPSILAPDPGKWRLINHIPFDGQREDHFRNTSLHLSFTQSEVPIVTERRGARDVEAFYVESLVSVYDHGMWIADLDIIKMIDSPLIFRTILTDDCRHSIREYDPSVLPLSSIDTWNEFLDSPPGTSIVRSCGNWLGRLATAAISIQRRNFTVILPKHMCWNCTIKTIEQHKATIDRATFSDSNSNAASREGIDSQEYLEDDGHKDGTGSDTDSEVAQRRFSERKMLLIG
jgi:hypothetical protein